MNLRLVDIKLDDLAQYIGECLEVDGAEQRLIPRVLRAEVQLKSPHVLRVLIEHPDFEDTPEYGEVAVEPLRPDRWPTHCTRCGTEFTAATRWCHPPYFDICKACYDEISRADG